MATVDVRDCPRDSSWRYFMINKLAAWVKSRCYAFIRINLDKRRHATWPISNDLMNTLDQSWVDHVTTLVVVMTYQSFNLYWNAYWDSEQSALKGYLLSRWFSAEIQISYPWDTGFDSSLGHLSMKWVVLNLCYNIKDTLSQCNTLVCSAQWRKITVVG